MEMQPTRITDIPRELLQSIIIHLAKSSDGAECLARTITVCKHFENFGQDENVLRVINFDNVKLSDVGVGLFECNNSLIKRCAQHGNISAQYLLAKIILSNFSEVPTDRLNNYFGATDAISEADLPASWFVSSKGKEVIISSVYRSKLYHYELVRLFLKQCNISDFALMLQCLIFYFHWFSSEAGNGFVRSMGHMIFILGLFATDGLHEDRWSYDPETKLLPADFEIEVIVRLRFQILRNLNMQEIRRDCKEMAELSIVLEHGKGDEEEGVLDLGERFYRHLLSKYFDEKVNLMDPGVLLSNSCFEQMKKLCVDLAKEYLMHRSDALKAFDEAFPSR